MPKDDNYISECDIDIAKVAEEAGRLISGMKECERLDRAAGEYRPGLSIRDWVSTRMREAVDRAQKDSRP